MSEYMKKIIDEVIEENLVSPFYNLYMNRITPVEGQFSRERNMIQQAYSIKFPSRVIILGCGGIGSHIAEILGSFKTTEHLILVDDDVVDISNLNRSYFTYEDIGLPKVQALNKNILLRNNNINIVPYIGKFNENSAKDLIEICRKTGFFHDRYFMYNDALIYDCRDDDYGDYSLLHQLLKENALRRSDYCIIRPAYNGYSITIDLDPDDGKKVFGRQGYSETPSHGLPSRLAALLAVTFSLKVLCDKSCLDTNHEYKGLVNKTFTFNAEDLLRIFDFGYVIQSFLTYAKDAVVENADALKNIDVDILNLLRIFNRVTSPSVDVEIKNRFYNKIKRIINETLCELK